MRNEQLKVKAVPGEVSGTIQCHTASRKAKQCQQVPQEKGKAMQNNIRESDVNIRECKGNIRDLRII